MGSFFQNGKSEGIKRQHQQGETGLGSMISLGNTVGSATCV